jgi:hypothetical protein
VVGVTDIDPFILSIVQTSSLAVATGVSAMVLAMLSNTAAKGIYFAFLVPGQRRQTAWRFALWALVHVPLILLP